MSDICFIHYKPGQGGNNGENDYRDRNRAYPSLADPLNALIDIIDWITASDNH